MRHATSRGATTAEDAAAGTTADAIAEGIAAAMSGVRAKTVGRAKTVAHARIAGPGSRLHPLL
jgi:hypothetical protein